MAVKGPNPPKGTGPSGRRVWRELMEAYEFEQHEIGLLVQITRTTDHLDALAEILAVEGLLVEGQGGQQRAHPALVEQRLQGIALARLQAALRLPSGEGVDQVEGRRPQRRTGVKGVYQPRALRRVM